ncbi:MAG: mechanosensitive ion channel family protein [Bacteroidota bacterium]
METLFTGSYVTVTRGVRIGDYVEFDTAQERLATDIGRRTTRIWMLQNNIAVVPSLPRC